MLRTYLRKFKRFLERTQEYFRLLAQFIVFSAANQFKRLNDGKPKIVFILNEEKLYRDADGSGRYPYLILNAFSEGDHSVYLFKRVDFRCFRRLSHYGRDIYYIKNLKVISRLPKDPESYILVFDNESLDPSVLKMGWKRRVYLNAFKPPSWETGDYRMWVPYFMHMLMYRFKEHQKLDIYRTGDKKIRVFFAGNTDKTYYDNPNLKVLYGQMTRIEGIRALLELGDPVRRILDTNELKDKLTSPGYRNNCEIFETNRFTIRPEQWFGVLSRMDFFVCLSGTDLPMCHNVIEAMALGVIPIISYPDWFFPPLEHKKNAILYHGKEGLQKAVREVLAMDETVIRSMRKNAIAYYEENLSIATFVKRFSAKNDKLGTWILHPRYVCTDGDIKEHSRASFVRMLELLNSV